MEGVNAPWHTVSNNIIRRVIPLTLGQQGDFTDEAGFFIRVETAGILKYCPVGNADNEYIVKHFAASTRFEDTELCRKIINLGTVSPAQAKDIYIGYPV